MDISAVGYYGDMLGDLLQNAFGKLAFLILGLCARLMLTLHNQANMCYQ